MTNNYKEVKDQTNADVQAVTSISRKETSLPEVDYAAVLDESEANDVAKLDAFSPKVFESAAQQEVMFSSFAKDGTRATAIKQYNAISDAEHALSDHIGKTIEVEHMVAHSIKMVDDVTGEMIDALRVVLVTPDGKGYHSVANGVVSSLQRIIGTVGQAPWTPALKISPVNKKTRKGFTTITLRLEA